MLKISPDLCHHISFDGALLRRGFWLYVCRIANKTKYFVYVGMTGDRPSGNAGSPFNRITTHFGKNLNNNAIMKKLEKWHIDPVECLYTTMAIGPIFEEEKTDKKLHESLCNQVEALEKAIAEHLKQHYTVISSHRNRPFSHKPDPEILKDIINLTERFLSEIK